MIIREGDFKNKFYFQTNVGGSKEERPLLAISPKGGFPSLKNQMNENFNIQPQLREAVSDSSWIRIFADFFEQPFLSKHTVSLTAALLWSFNLRTFFESLQGMRCLELRPF